MQGSTRYKGRCNLAVGDGQNELGTLFLSNEGTQDEEDIDSWC